MVILVVEDDFVVAHSVSRVLEEAGHCVLGPVADSRTALEAVADIGPDLALIDIRLGPGDDGTVLARELSRRWEVPSILTSGQPGLARAARSAALGYVGKPFLPGTILQCVEFVRALRAGHPPDRAPAKLELFAEPPAGE